MTEVNSTTDLVPFGKYRGQPIGNLINDPDYFHWVQNNLSDYIQQRYPELYHVVLNNGRRATDTRQHNRLQSLFLDELYRRAFCRVARPRWEEEVWQTFSAEVSRLIHMEHS